MSVLDFLFELSTEARSIKCNSSININNIISSIDEFYINSAQKITQNELKEISTMRNKFLELLSKNNYIQEMYNIDDDYIEIIKFNENTYITIQKIISEAIENCSGNNYNDKIFFPKNILEDDVTEIIKLTIEEIVTCRNNGCNLACIVLCGKVLETALGALYKKEFDEDADEKNFGIQAIVNRLKKKYALNPSIIDQINIISKHRNKSVHGSIIVPTNDEADGILSLTKDTLLKITCTKSSKLGADSEGDSISCP
ncbi:MAG: hypothetical protein WCR47_01805 [Desulfoplanes sp.]